MCKGNLSTTPEELPVAVRCFHLTANISVRKKFLTVTNSIFPSGRQVFPPDCEYFRQEEIPDGHNKTVRSYGANSE